MKWLAEYKINQIGRKERNLDNIPDTLEVQQCFLDQLHHTLMTMAYDIKGHCFKVLQMFMTTNRMPTKHMVRAIIQDTIETELPSFWNNAIGNVLIGRYSSSGSNS